MQLTFSHEFPSANHYVFLKLELHGGRILQEHLFVEGLEVLPADHFLARRSSLRQQVQEELQLVRRCGQRGCRGHGGRRGQSGPCGQLPESPLHAIQSLQLLW